MFTVTITKLTQPLDPKIEWPLIADYDIELVVTRECMTIPTAQHKESRYVRVTVVYCGALQGYFGERDGLHWVVKRVNHCINDGEYVRLANNNDFRQSHQPDRNPTRQLAGAPNISITDSDTIVFDTYNREVTLVGVGTHTSPAANTGVWAPGAVPS